MGFSDAEAEAVETIRAYAACQMVDGCDLCPLYTANGDRREQQKKCQDALTKERIKEALRMLERASA